MQNDACVAVIAGAVDAAMSVRSGVPCTRVRVRSGVPKSDRKLKKCRKPDNRYHFRIVLDDSDENTSEVRRRENNR
jgi:hypothetical protein